MKQQQLYEGNAQKLCTTHQEIPSLPCQIDFDDIGRWVTHIILRRRLFIRPSTTLSCTHGDKRRETAIKCHQKCTSYQHQKWLINK